MILADKTLFLAGAKDIDGNGLSGLKALEQKRDGSLIALSADNGTQLAELALESPPVFDGMAAANGKLYISTLNGKVLCMGGQ